MKKNKGNQRQMFALIEQFKTSNKTLKSFCQEQSLPQWRFYYWRRKYTQHHQPVGFIPVSVTTTKENISCAIDIHYPNGVCISLSELGDLSFLQSLIRLG